MVSRIRRPRFMIKSRMERPQRIHRETAETCERDPRCAVSPSWAFNRTHRIRLNFKAVSQSRLGGHPKVFQLGGVCAKGFEIQSGFVSWGASRVNGRAPGRSGEPPGRSVENVEWVFMGFLWVFMGFWFLGTVLIGWCV